MSVAARATTARNNTATNSRAVRRTRVRVRRGLRVNFRQVTRLLITVSLLAMLFGYVRVYAGLAMTGYSRDSLVTELRQEKLRNEELQVKWNTLSSPQRVVCAAEKAGMTYASDYDYINKPKNVASAEQN